MASPENPPRKTTGDRTTVLGGRSEDGYKDLSPSEASSAFDMSVILLLKGLDEHHVVIRPNVPRVISTSYWTRSHACNSCPWSGWR